MGLTGTKNYNTTGTKIIALNDILLYTKTGLSHHIIIDIQIIEFTVELGYIEHRIERTSTLLKGFSFPLIRFALKKLWNIKNPHYIEIISFPLSVGYSRVQL